MNWTCPVVWHAGDCSAVLSAVVRAATLSLRAPPPCSAYRPQPCCLACRARELPAAHSLCGGMGWPAQTPRLTRSTVLPFSSPPPDSVLHPVRPARRRESSRSARDIAPLSRPHRRTSSPSLTPPHRVSARGYLRPPGLLHHSRALADAAAAACPHGLLRLFYAPPPGRLAAPTRRCRSTTWQVGWPTAARRLRPNLIVSSPLQITRSGHVRSNAAESQT